MEQADFERFDLILAMDGDNLKRLREQCPPRHRGKLALLGVHARRHRGGAVRDPYYGPPAGFEQALDMLEDACDGLIEHLASVVRHDKPGAGAANLD